MTSTSASGPTDAAPTPSRDARVLATILFGLALARGLVAMADVFLAYFAQAMADTGCHPPPAQPAIWAAHGLLIVV